MAQVAIAIKESELEDANRAVFINCMIPTFGVIGMCAGVSLNLQITAGDDHST